MEEIIDTFTEFNEEELEIEFYVRLENITRELIILKSGMTEFLEHLKHYV